jgi:hypothetical protein
MKSSYILSIPTSCHESSEEMTKVKQGRFYQGQQNKVITTPANKRRRLFISIAVVLVSIIIAAIPPVRAQNKVKEIQTMPDRSDTVSVPQRSDTISCITGMVTDRTGNAIIGASVRLDTLTISTATDSLGRFEIKIPLDYKETTITLIINYVGFAKYEVYLPRTSTKYVPANPMLCIWMERKIEGKIRPPLWPSIKYRLHRFFH